MASLHSFPINRRESEIIRPPRQNRGGPSHARCLEKLPPRTEYAPGALKGRSASDLYGGGISLALRLVFASNVTPRWRTPPARQHSLVLRGFARNISRCFSR